LAVSFSLDGSSTGCSLSAGEVTYTSAGTCRIHANQAGDSTHLPAPQVQGITVIQPLPSGFRITTASLPNGSFGVAYSATLTAADGIAPYKWKKVTKPPKGLKLNATTGVISGTPKLRGTFSFTVQARYKTKALKQPAVWHTASRVLSITVT
jgi:hypothetical protein